VLKLKAQNCDNLPAKMPTIDLQWVYNTGNVGFIKDVLIKLFCAKFIYFFAQF